MAKSMRAAVEGGRCGAACRPHSEARPCRAVEPAIRPGRDVRLPDPPLLLVTDRRQARLPLPDVVGAALAAGCRWVSVREKDLSEDDQIALARDAAADRAPPRRVPDAARRCGLGARPAASTACTCRPAAIRSRRASCSGPDKLIGVSIHTVTEADGGRSGMSSTMRSRGRPSRPRASPATVPRSAARGSPNSPVLRACRWSPSAASTPCARPKCWRPVRSAFAVMGGVMRAADPGREVRGLLSVLAQP